MQGWRMAGLLFGLALLLRASLPSTIITVDEAYHWFARAGSFLAAVRAGAYADTNIIGHPGVTTMWLSAGGLLAQQALAGAAWLDASDPATRVVLLRLPLALVHALCLAGGYLLLRRLLGAGVALLAALLWATEPFLLAHSQLVHVDALLTSWMLLALLAALLALRYDQPDAPGGLHWGWWLASALAGGLALLTKSPSVLLLPLIGLAALVFWLQHTRASLGGAGRLLLAGLAWLAVAGVVWLLLWPAAWVDAAGAAQRMINQVRYEGASPHGWGNFFLGQPIDTPGPLFYPVALVLRLAPWTLAGVLLALLALLPGTAWPTLPGRRVLLLVLAWVLLVGLVFSAAPKKFDRYLLPVVPLLHIVAAAGLLWAARTWLRPTARRIAGSGLALLLAGTLAWYYPYYLAYYNPLLGGGGLAARVLPVGWGEGLEQAAAYINAQPDGCTRPTATWFAPVLARHACGPVLHLREASTPGRAAYAVLYRDQLQRANAPAATRYVQQQGALVHTVRLHGIDYAQVYHLPLPLPHRSTARFGGQFALHSYGIETATLRTSGVLTLTTQWQALPPWGTVAAGELQDYLLFAHLYTASGQRVGQIDVPPAGPPAPTATWNPWHFYAWPHPLPVPPDLPPGRYWLALGVYDPLTGARLPLQGTPPPPRSFAGPDALLLPLRLP